MIALDFDLTIYDHAKPKDTLGLQKIMAQLAEHGIRIGLASGRGPMDLKKVLDEIGWKWAHPFPAFVVGHEGEIFQPCGEHWPGARDYNINRRQTVEQANQWLVPCFETLLIWAKAAGLELMHPISTSAGGVHVVFQNPDMAEVARRKLVQMLEDHSEISVLRNHHILLAIPRAASKGAALQQLLALEGLARNQLLCIGDNLNDWSMLCEDRGFCIATVANADRQIRSRVAKQGGYISSERISHGVKDIFNHYLHPILQQ